MNGCQEQVEELEILLRERLGANDDKFWKIGYSDLSGRGVIATDCIHTGQVIFTDTPIVIGPRSCAEGDPICITCFKSGNRLKPCEKGCRLPLCSEKCLEKHISTPECKKLQTLGVEGSETWSPDIYRALTPFRCLSLNKRERDIISLLQPHPPNGLAPEIHLLKRSIKNALCEEDEEWMDLCCRVMNANAFQAVTDDFDSKQSPLRGLYPLAGLMNHSCSPNTRQVFDSNHNLNLISVKEIKQGEEITTSYCPLLWATSVRIPFLLKTKHFICSCSRCLDNTEHGTYLSALKCNCGGIILPVNPQDPKSQWNCEGCNRSLSCGQALVANTLLFSHPGKTKNKLALHESNHMLVDSTIRIIFSQRHSVQGMNKMELNEREINIRKILNIINQLNLGECRTRGLLLHELHRTIKEKVDRALVNKSEDEEEILNESYKILQGDIFIPKDIINRLLTYKSTSNQ